MHFLIQTIEQQVVHDFSFYLIEAIKYTNWFRNREVHTYTLSDNHETTDGLFIGTVEETQKFLQKKYSQQAKPINIPSQLMVDEFLMREVKLQKGCDIKANMFVKDIDVIKSETPVLNPEPDKTYLVSEYLPEILSEWRAFIHNSKLVGLQNYSGDFTRYPNTLLINKMIKTYTNCPTAYTLDVAVIPDLIQNTTVLIEVHDFFSCGLYGFSDMRILPQMYIDWYTWFERCEYV